MKLMISSVYKLKSKYNTDVLAMVLFVMFYARRFFIWGCDRTLQLFGIEDLGRYLFLLILYSSYFLLCMVHKKYFIKDFFVLLIIVITFFGITYAFHPEYEYVYNRDYYGVLPYVLRPDNGIYAYLFVRLLNDPGKIERCLKWSSVFLIVQSFVSLYIALRRGYWPGQNYLGNATQYSYNLEIGYALLLPVCVFLYEWLNKRKIMDLFFAVGGIFVILIAGGRGTILDIVIFLTLYVLMKNFNSKRKFRNILLIVTIGILVLINFETILTLIANVFAAFNVSSRTITKFLDGSISNGTGRELIWLSAINLIKENPFGYGAMGARNGLYGIHFVGHPHNFFLEVLIDYGVVLGCVLLFLMLLGSLRILFSDKRDGWNWMYLLFLANACTLLTSFTYWHHEGVWGALAVAVCIYQTSRKKMIIRCSNENRKQNN